jgi:hypothetical protein
VTAASGVIIDYEANPDVESPDFIYGKDQGGPCGGSLRAVSKIASSSDERWSNGMR